MFNSDSPQFAPADQQAVDRVVAAGPRGALMLAGIATVIVVLMWLVFYLFVFMPRGALQ
ncbi:hypothetical protein [Bradyrhizobium sp. STM 3562]|jgi:hypothetical protein|uniref:hypothetical protein n=1 Tax=Bradyrhizobium sp. STM 3562 TaxID=578924 RepID=UPI00388DB6EF